MTKRPEQQKENGLAIASLVLGIVSIVGFGGALTGIPAMITGFMSLNNPHNKNLGIIGIVLGGLSTLFTFLLLGILILLIIIGAMSAETVPSSPGPSFFDESYSELQI